MTANPIKVAETKAVLRDSGWATFCRFGTGGMTMDQNAAARSAQPKREWWLTPSRSPGRSSRSREAGCG